MRLNQIQMVEVCIVKIKFHITCVSLRPNEQSPHDTIETEKLIVCETSVGWWHFRNKDIYVVVYQ